MNDRLDNEFVKNSFMYIDYTSLVIIHFGETNFLGKSNNDETFVLIQQSCEI